MPVCHLFLGPSGHGLPPPLLDLPGLYLHSPVVRGDVATLVREEEPSVLAIADGLFHARPAVGHKEILEALRLGWRVIGISSIGALRAAEMHSLGMEAFGEIANRFMQEPETPDDYVALLHGPPPGYAPISEPQVHHERFLAAAVAADFLTSDRATGVKLTLARMWFGDRTLTALRNLVFSVATSDAVRQELNAMLANFDQYRIKVHDVGRFLQEAPWRSAPKPIGAAHDVHG